jgi:hypothetical protein
MVTLKSVEKQLKRIRFNHSALNHAEAMELPNILMKGEVIYECVNGTYEGGFALLCATNVRILLVDKKPFKYLTVEDLRFDMINQIDYSHRLFGARISVSAGSKNLKFMSFNQERLRKLIGHVQHCMAESKKEQSTNAESQQQHLEKINQQLQAYLLAQHQQQEALRKQLEQLHSSGSDKDETILPQPQAIKPSPQLSDYLFAQTLLKQYEASQGHSLSDVTNTSFIESLPVVPSMPQAPGVAAASDLQEAEIIEAPQLADLYSAGMQEVFGKQANVSATIKSAGGHAWPTVSNPLEINPLRIAYSKLPLALRDRAFARRLSSHKRPEQSSASSTQTAGI